MIVERSMYMVKKLVHIHQRFNYPFAYISFLMEYIRVKNRTTHIFKNTQIINCTPFKLQKTKLHKISSNSSN